MTTKMCFAGILIVLWITLRCETGELNFGKYLVFGDFQATYIDALSPLLQELFHVSKATYKPIYRPQPNKEDRNNHPCKRECDGKPKTCFYDFNVEWYQSMSKACYNCPFDNCDCDKKDCVMANGINRQIIVVNRMMPGPSIEVCQYDKIIVNVTNNLMAAGTAIHWHGMHQKETPYMDGVPFVTQCPVQPESTFTYKFTAAEAGTHFWHSHIGLQRGDGVTGALIVRKPKRRDFYGFLYDFDESDHVIQIQDWISRPSQGVYTAYYHSNGNLFPSSVLINGRGRFEVTNGNRTTISRAPRFNVKKGYRYRFRLINAGYYNCPVELTVGGHDFTVIATDGNYLKPVNGKSLVMYAGERFDIIINANQNVDNYWIRFRGLLSCINLPEVRQVAVLHYDGADDGEPPGATQWGPRLPDETQINTENQGEENITMTISKLKSALKPLPSDQTLKPEPDYKFYVAYDFYYKDNYHFNKVPYYSHDQVREVNPAYSVPIPQLNHISMKLSDSPLLVSRPSSDIFCDNSTVSKNCKETYCECPHVLSVKLNSVVEVILIDEGKPFAANHPFHLHGHNFRVLGQRHLGLSTTAEDVINLDSDGLISRNLKDPPVKDTVTVPDGGYTVIRFTANNPGYWLLHCHIEFHAEVGMTLAFKVGEHNDMPPVPEHFPKCGNYQNNEETELENDDENNQMINPFLSQKLGTISRPNNAFGRVEHFNSYHSILDMPKGDQMEIVYRSPRTDSK